MSDPNLSKFTGKKELALKHMERTNWTIYTLASTLDVKAKDIYLNLDFNTRLMFIRLGKLKACHATEGLYDETEKQPVKPKRINPRTLFDQIFGQD